MSSGAANFSASLTLAGMDYIAPSAACIKPTLISNGGAAGTDGGVVGVKVGGAQVGSLPAAAEGGSRSRGAHPDVVKITLQDCLACSGCVTTAETVLVNAQSRSEIITTLLDTSSTHSSVAPTAATPKTASTKATSRARLVSISPQSCASLAAYVGLSMTETYALISGFLRTVLTPVGLQAQAAAAAAAAGATAGTRRSSLEASATPADRKDEGAVAHPSSLSSSTTDTPIYIIDLEWAEQLSAALTAQEYARRRDEAPETLPMIVSACPGWVCYCEKQGSALLPHLCPVMSAQGIAGSYAKRVVAADLYHISIQPCFDRKLEAARDFMVPASAESAPGSPVLYTDCVLSTAELLEWMKETDEALPWRGPLDTSTHTPDMWRGVGSAAEASAHLAENEETSRRGRGQTMTGASSEPGATVQAAARDAARLAGSGGYIRCVVADRLQRQQATVGGIAPGTSTEIKYEMKRNRNHQLATCAALPGEVFCVGYGFQQIQNVVRGVKKKMPAMRGYTFVELMACPDGCLNGGGQIRPALQPHTEVLEAVIDAYAQHINADGKVTAATITPVDAQKCEDEENCTQCPGVESAPRVTSHVDSARRHPFAAATIAAVAPSLGDNLWRCAFRDREKEFAEMLNAGNVHSLKW
ncbi:putative Hydrogenase [Leptomonas seymouri]|uniref:Putative Hydrogenase n=1 Tax=Leptomonas seymouri TaxID=5684 RepID=A0A0N0P2B2_LEPSE|nr:putative Hydrogenase [Leptomonas seymouri]|eukprot:KPI82749.1 putative Hydrogenase [Leptomonas seymouri]